MSEVFLKTVDDIGLKNSVQLSSLDSTLRLLSNVLYVAAQGTGVIRLGIICSEFLSRGDLELIKQTTPFATTKVKTMFMGYREHALSSLYACVIYKSVNICKGLPFTLHVYEQLIK